MSTRYAKMKEYLTKYRLKTKEKRIKLMSYFREQRQKIIQRQRKKLVKRIFFWGIFLGGGFIVYDELYRKKMQINKMAGKLDNLYGAIMVKEHLKDDLYSTFLFPKNLDELSNILSLAYRYHYKIIVRMDNISKKQKIKMAEQFNGKCLFIDLTALKNVEINAINNTLYVESGACCADVNNQLLQNGYAQLFPEQLDREKIYDVIVNNLPLNNGELNKYTISMQLISSSGQNFRSTGETNRYGQIPSLNSLFIGTGGIFALPTALNLKITPRDKQELKEERLSVNIKDVNERVIAFRNLNQIRDDQIQVTFSNTDNGQLIKNSTFLNCKERYPIHKEYLTKCQQLTDVKNIPTSKYPKHQQTKKQRFNLYFSINQSIFQYFILKFDKKLPYQYKNGLLKVWVQDNDNEQKFISVINEITNNNGALVWCQSKQLLMRIKPSLDSSEVGAQLMRKIVEVREGLDRRGVLYSHSRFEDYFAKGVFRKLTEFFW